MYIPVMGDEGQNNGFNGSPQKKLGLLPEIKGPVKSIKQLLLQDLEADGVIKSRIPFSTRKRQKSLSMESSLQHGYQSNMT